VVAETVVVLMMNLMLMMTVLLVVLLMLVGLTLSQGPPESAETPIPSAL
jgi:hypothetical protein